MKDYSSYPNTTSNHTVLKIMLAAFALLVLFVAGFGVYLYSKFSQPLTYYSRPAVFEVQKGESAGKVGQRLAQEKLISSPLAFRFYLLLHSGLRVQAGRFNLDSSMTLRQVAQNLSAGRGIADEIRVTFVEGRAGSEYGKQLVAAGMINASDFSKVLQSFSESGDFGFLADKPKAASLEGYLFPDTYRFDRVAASVDVMKKMLANFDEKLTRQMRTEISRQNMTIFEAVTLASIIEGEVGRNFKAGTKLSAADLEKIQAERELVSGVFHNRLRINMALQSDATIAFITGSHKTRASSEDIKIESPYNTYLYRGLPPGPIGNPGLDSIKAAIYPSTTDYLYFLSKTDGEAVFAKTLEEHNANKAEYLQ